MIESIIYKPRTGDEISKATHGAPVYLYSELVNRAKQIGPAGVLLEMMKKHNKNFILVQDPHKMNSGHWTALEFKPLSKEVYFFSSYGGMPDREKMAWISPQELQQSGQVMNVINDGLKQFALHGWQVHYSQYRYQKPGDNTATCGIWSSAFMNSGENPDVFYRNTKRRRLSPVDYYQAYF